MNEEEEIFNPIECNFDVNAKEQVWYNCTVVLEFEVHVHLLSFNFTDCEIVISELFFRRLTLRLPEVFKALGFASKIDAKAAKRLLLQQRNG
ncbi:hypothetical protein M9H77_36253 [Catharanthus roseus]|uniref:Uncharacterized protein n=1 Tax=Catharanthus roseus TaxID=4058 RepID=A0ACB9ZS35_CATRO|nr:hypothetical protein M9H77_36253 [Catharanthus roseus]